jgi:hypothetical protein
LASYVSADADAIKVFENFAGKNPYQDLMSERDLMLHGVRKCNRGSKA